MLSVVICLLVLSLSMPSEAEAKIRVGNDDSTTKVASVTIPPGLASSLPSEWANNGRLSHLATTFWLGLGVYVVDKGLVIEANGTDKYWPMDAEKIAQLQSLGVLPDPLPPSEIPAATYVFGYAFWPGLLLLILLIVQSVRKAKRATKKFHAEAGSSFADLLREVLIATAKADGEIDPREVALIADYMSKITGQEVKQGEIRNAIATHTLEEKDLTDYLSAIAAGLKPPQRLMVIDGIRMLAAADGSVDKSEKKFLERCCTSLMIPKKQIRKIVAAT
ncbi:MAG: TerB family tellurite resistance protein [Alphaproteobacteria bacterium]|nr:TerB family tellurite resistance protein [Alphaproteobacteria bacterium SS10]